MEVIMLVRSPVWWCVPALLICFILYAIIQGAQGHNSDQLRLKELLNEEAKRFAQMGALSVDVLQGNEAVIGWKHSFNPELVGRSIGARYVVKPELPFAFAITGQGDLQPSALKVTTLPKDEWVYANEWGNPLILFMGQFDLGFVLTYLLPLAIIVLFVNVLTTESDDGVIELIRTQGGSLKSLLFLKFTVRGVVFFALVASVTISGLILYAPWGNQAFGLVFFDCLLLLKLILIYTVVWLIIVAGVNSFLRPVSTSLAILIFAWTVFLIVIPAGFNLLFDSLNERPGRFVYMDQKRAVLAGAEAESDAELRKFYHDHPELIGLDDAEAMGQYSTMRTAIMLSVEQQLGSMLSDFDDNWQIKKNMSYRFGLIAFPTLFQEALAEFAGTSDARHAYFLKEVNRFHRLYRTFFFERIIRGTQFVDFHRIPRFDYREEYIINRWHRVTHAMACMVLLPTVLFIIRIVTWHE
jgi:ABC-2 type transport system permease protein